MKKLTFLLIEDDEIERMKFHRVFEQEGFDHTIIEAINGESAQDMLKKEPLPDVILLDLNMPKMNGLEFLNHLKKDPVLKYIPAIVLTTSNNHRDMLECYKIGIAGYLLKPLKYQEYIAQIKVMVHYWEKNEFIKGKK